jgi:hypothetical protein
MKRFVIFALSVTLLFIRPGAIPAQDKAEAFLQRARAATARYQDQSIAIFEGYRRIGQDFPSMGEHWIQLDLLFDNRIDAEHPEVLTYVTVDGKATLTGVAYLLPLLSGESPPDLPAPKEAWHDHYRTIEDETTLPQHHLSGTAAGGPRMVMLHAWIWTPNPDGVFAADNWALPYIRTGFTPPEHKPRTAALALSLLSGGVDYFTPTVNSVASPSRKQRIAIDAAFATARSAVAQAIRENAIDGLADIWNKLLLSLESAVGSKRWKEVRAVLPAN